METPGLPPEKNALPRQEKEALLNVNLAPTAFNKEIFRQKNTYQYAELTLFIHFSSCTAAAKEFVKSPRACVIILPFPTTC
ncbi:hypothetical protein [Mailhella massiliensis]|uniref:hypothetical protein n=1 Tax=Mailhella massiliensis TaxID=1903261 RepID=UPI0011865471|nr:hypothetical protein [Mailhella massiliensis]